MGYVLGKFLHNWRNMGLPPKFFDQEFKIFAMSLKNLTIICKFSILYEKGGCCYMYLDYSISSPEDRNDYIKQLINNGQYNEKALELMADYLVLCMEKEDKKKKVILTDNRQITVNKRETSLEGLTDKLENGEDGLYSMIANDKNIIFSHSVSITPEDLQTIPFLSQLRAEIDKMSNTEFTGKKAYLAKKMLIEMRKDQYVIKNAYQKPITFVRTIKGSPQPDFSEDIALDSDNNIVVKGNMTLYEPLHISALLCNYSALKEYSYEDLNSDMRWLIKDLEDLIDRTLKDKYPMYYDLLIYKIDGDTNAEIQVKLQDKHGVFHSLEYISSLYRNKIPKLLSDKAREDWLNWYFTVKEKGKWKTCTKCGETKLAHNIYFSRNGSAKNGYYSICKECRNRK